MLWFQPAGESRKPDCALQKGVGLGRTPARTVKRPTSECLGELR
jgi:hypothetical protein